jgi:hypothetical protein
MHVASSRAVVLQCDVLLSLCVSSITYMLHCISQLVTAVAVAVAITNPATVLYLCVVSHTLQVN